MSSQYKNKNFKLKESLSKPIISSFRRPANHKRYFSSEKLKIPLKSRTNKKKKLLNLHKRMVSLPDLFTKFG
jgi:hypothetical protein